MGKRQAPGPFEEQEVSLGTNTDPGTRLSTQKDHSGLHVSGSSWCPSRGGWISPLSVQE